MAPKLAACVHGTLVLSGILATQVEDICRRYEAKGLKSIRPVDTQGEWAAIEMVRAM